MDEFGIEAPLQRKSPCGPRARNKQSVNRRSVPPEKGKFASGRNLPVGFARNKQQQDETPFSDVIFKVGVEIVCVA
ncbi:hypothetical protein [Rhizobium sp. G21]|uniref:hypothetical protein n=1 Tax=Rhizobium sp. G21 TaxID=2758439 RepID=UPI0015FFB559|nr:hypothetical protein [Rhizobium sp. G21]MBB1251461.1 hypothetical protein [Rhizobium sp. G21]